MKYFLDVAATEHISRSAQRLHVAQPALSRTIHHLEDELGCALFAHEGRNIRLTAEGRLARDRIGAAVHQLDALRDDLDIFENCRQTTVHVEVRAGSYVTMEAISAWMGEHPESRIRLVQSGAHDDAASDIVVDCSAEGEEPQPGIENRSFSERILIAIPSAYDVEGDSVTLDQLRPLSFVSLAASSGFRRVCDQVCARNGFAPSVAFESDNPAVVRKAISLALGVGFWPEWSWGAVQGDDVRLKAVAVPDFTRTIHLTRLTSHGREFYRFLCGFFARTRRMATNT